MENGSNKTSVSLVSDTIQDAKKLVELEVALVHAEIRGALERLRRTTLLGALIGFAILPAGFFLGMAFVSLLREQLGWPVSTCYFVVFLGFLAVGLCAGIYMKRIWTERGGQP